VLKLVLLAAAILVLGILAATADAYYQSFKVYRDVRVVLPNLRQASDHLARGQLPPGDPFGKADVAVRRARQDVDQARFTFRLTGALPILGRPVNAVRHGVAAASHVTRAALITERVVTDLLGEAVADPVSVRAADTPLYRGGVVNVDLLGETIPRLQRIVSNLRAAHREIRSIPSIPFLSQVDKATREAIADSTRAVRIAERTLAGFRLLPAFLGAEEKKTYLLALQNGTDLRGTGGAVLAYAVITIDKGRFTLIRGGGINDIDMGFLSRRIAVDLTPETQWYVDHVPDLPWPNAMNYSPNFPQAAVMWARMVAKVTNLRIDGVIGMDQTAVARLLGTRRIRVPAYPRPITGSNLTKVVSHDQYLLPRAQQDAFPAQLIVAAWPKILDPESLQAALKAFGESLAEKRLQLWSGTPNLQQRIRQLGWDGGVRVGEGDFLYVADNKVVPNKVDYYSRISIDYRVTIDGSGNGSAALETTLTNESPPGLPRSIAGRSAGGGGYAVNGALMLAFVPQRAELISAVPGTGLPDHLEAGARVFARTIRARAGGAASMELHYRTPGLVTTAGGRKLYRLTLQHQPMLYPAALTVTVTLPKGATVSAAPQGWTVKGNVLTLETHLTHDVVYEIVF